MNFNRLTNRLFRNIFREIGIDSRLILLIGVLACSVLNNSTAQNNNRYASALIYQDLQKLNTLANVLYVAAHPDDENTRMISYFSNVLHANTAYFSFTRGDGGQNLIGTEIGDLLGVLRTQELLQARSIDGGNQFFSRAIDFGYSKHPDETLAIWDEDKAKYDIIKVIRQFRPDVIINRFDHRTPGKTHGHHTSSAILSVDVFEKAGDKNVFPEQLSEFDVWQPSRLFFNTSWWFYGSREKFAEADKSNLISMDIGEYIPIIGQSNAEIASAARSMHKCQGFGSAGSRASRQEYLEIIKGTNPKPSQSPFADIDISWNRVEGGAPIDKALHDLLANFDFTNPSSHIDELLDIHSLISNCKDPFWKNQKLPLLEEIIASATGLYLDAFTDTHKVSYGDTTELKIEATSRTDFPITVHSYSIPKLGISASPEVTLVKGEENLFYENMAITDKASFTTPYWLVNDHALGSFDVDDTALIGKAQNDPAFDIRFSVSIKGRTLEYTRPIQYKYVEPSFGEITKPFEIIPPVSVSLSEEVYVFASEASQKLQVELTAGKNAIEGDLSLQADQSWSITPKSHSFSLQLKGEKQVFEFTVTPPKDGNVSNIVPTATLNGKDYALTTHTIAYDHIPEQTVSVNASAVLSRIPLVRRGKNSVGYIMGAGDKIPDALTNMGYDVVDLDPSQPLGDLSEFQAIIIGIRAYNTVESLPIAQRSLFDYVKAGGNLITQYNTTWRLKSDEVAPYSLQLSRDRVCQEDAPVRILKPDHPCMFYPNVIDEQDFEGWVQERGLYFPNEWAPEYDAILSMNDSGEDPKEGSLLVAEYGDGYFVYTGLSFFRELPAGVPGAYRIMANLISLGTNKR